MPNKFIPSFYKTGLPVSIFTMELWESKQPLAFKHFYLINTEST